MNDQTVTEILHILTHLAAKADKTESQLTHNSSILNRLEALETQNETAINELRNDLFEMREQIADLSSRIDGLQDEKQATTERIVATLASIPWQNLALFGIALAIAVGAVSIHDVVAFVRSLIGGQ
jgi:chromosome segregation ATPase